MMPALALSRTPQRREVVAGVHHDGLNGIDRAGAAIRVSYLLGVLVWAFAVAWSTDSSLAFHSRLSGLLGGF